jgi:hypothetical protein
MLILFSFLKSAYENHIEELQTWGAVRQSFVICIYDIDKVTLKISLNEIKNFLVFPIY